MPNRFERALERRSRDTAGATEEFREFDPRAAAEESARAQFDVLEEDMGEGFERLRGRQVSAGRLSTGFGMEDQDRFMRDRLDRLDRMMSQQAMRAAGMRQDQLGRAAGMEGQTLRIHQQERNRADRQAGDLGGTIGSAVGGLAGAMPFTPFDPATGAMAGGGAGRGIAGLF